MRIPILLLVCGLLGSCDTAVPEPANGGANYSGANSVANAPATDTPARDPLLVEIDVLEQDLVDLADRVTTATPDDLKSGRQGFAEEAKALAERGDDIEKRVADSGNDIAKAHWKEASVRLKEVSRPIVEKLGSLEDDGDKARLEVKQLGDLLAALYLIMSDDRKKRKLKDSKHAERGGVEFWEFALKYKLIDEELLPKLVSPNSTSDVKSDGVFIEEADGRLRPENCSYTAPKVRELLLVSHKRGRDRTVIISFNSRNWNNYPDEGVLVLWSDAEVATYMTFDEAQEQYGITAEEWADPAGKLFGKKAPFQFTYE